MRFDEPDILSLAEAAAALPGKVAVSTVWRWCRVGHHGVILDSLRVGGRIYTSRRALQAFCEARSVATPRLEPSLTRQAQIEAEEIAELRRLGFNV